MFGSAVAERAVRITDDYPADTTFPHAWMTDEVVRSAPIRSMVVAPLITGDEVLGALGVYRSTARAIGEQDASLVRALADHAAVVGRQRAPHRPARQLPRGARAAARSRSGTLREITARIAVLRSRPSVLQRVVDESQRLLGADGAHLRLMTDHGDYLVPAVVADSTDAATTAWLRRHGGSRSAAA